MTMTTELHYEPPLQFSSLPKPLLALAVPPEHAEEVFPPHPAEAVELVDLGQPDLPGEEAHVGVRGPHPHQHVGVGQAAVRTEGGGHGALVDVLGCNTEQCSYNF